MITFPQFAAWLESHGIDTPERLALVFDPLVLRERQNEIAGQIRLLSQAPDNEAAIAALVAQNAILRAEREQKEHK